MRRFSARDIVLKALGLLPVTAALLVFHAPPSVTSASEVLESETWVGKELPVLKYIDIGQKLRTGRWLVKFHHYDCPAWQKTIARCQQMARGLSAQPGFPRMAFVEIPPYGPDPLFIDNIHATRTACP